jgi:fructokinase/2-dehydro-3-deoxygluconokinase
MAHPRKPVLVIGDVCVDLVVKAPQKSGNDRQQPQPELHGGGTAGNTAVALARLGLPTGFIGMVGDDGYGRFARDGLEAEGIDVSQVLASREAYTALALALIDPQGERTLLGWPRRGAAHTKLAADQIEPSLVAAAAWVHTTGMCMVEPPVRDALLRAMELAQAAHVPVSFDLNLRLGFEEGRFPEPFLESIWQAISLADYVLGSAADEIHYLAPADSVEASIRRLADGRRTVIARLGAEGVMAISAGGALVTVPAFPVEVVDTIGAGDAFNAGFVAARIEGKPLAEALRWGNTVAALKLGRTGGRGTPHRGEVEAFLTRRQGGEDGEK